MPTSIKKKASAGRAMKPSGAATRSKSLLPYSYPTEGRSKGKAIRPEGAPKPESEKKKKSPKSGASKSSNFGAKKTKSSPKKTPSKKSPPKTRKVVPSKTKKPKSTTLVQPASLQGYRGVMVVSTMPQGGYPVGCGVGSQTIRL